MNSDFIKKWIKENCRGMYGGVWQPPQFDWDYEITENGVIFNENVEIWTNEWKIPFKIKNSKTLSILSQIRTFKNFPDEIDGDLVMNPMIEQFNSFIGFPKSITKELYITTKEKTCVVANDLSIFPEQARKSPELQTFFLNRKIKQLTT